MIEMEVGGLGAHDVEAPSSGVPTQSSAITGRPSRRRASAMPDESRGAQRLLEGRVQGSSAPALAARAWPRGVQPPFGVDAELDVVADGLAHGPHPRDVLGQRGGGDLALHGS